MFKEKDLMLGMCRFFVDEVPIRVFKNSKDLGVKFPFDQPMKIYNSLWNADDWATRGGLEKTDWSKAPFIAAYKGFHIDGCEASVNAKFCDTQGKSLSEVCLHNLIQVPENGVSVVFFRGIKPEIDSLLSITLASGEHICLQNVRLSCSVPQELKVYLIMLRVLGR